VSVAATQEASPARAGRRPFRPLTVSRVDRLCADAAAVTFDVPAGLAAEYAFAPGQSLTLRRACGGREERRSYSVCAPDGAPLRIGVRAVVGGAVSPWLVHQVRPGDQVEVQPPAGTFTPDLTVPGRHVLIAAGSGITPVLSIAASVLAGPRSQVTLIYGNRRAATVMFADELADLKDSYPQRLQLVHVLSREPQEAELLSGRLDPARLNRLLPAVCDVAGTDHFWLCGPYPVVTGGCEAVIVLAARRTSVTIPPGMAVLDGAQRARPDLPFACKGGVCGTCRARLVAGEVRMRRNFALEQAELDAGFVLTCQSLPQSAELTVDYDE
jgi:ring-1,2-phenylacetyl-CoA epoxidase subunit PaaE